MLFILEHRHLLEFDQTVLD